MSVVLANYDLAPSVGIERIIAESAEAVAWVREHGDEINADPERLVTAGHSAGSHLAVCALNSADGKAPGVRGAIAISGIFDLEPLCGTSINEALRLDAAACARLSPIRHIEPSTAPLFLAVGESETAEFRRQSLDFAVAWQAQGNVCDMHRLPGLNHFNIIVEFAREDSVMHRASRTFIDRVTGPRKERAADGSTAAMIEDRTP